MYMSADISRCPGQLNVDTVSSVSADRNIWLNMKEKKPPPARPESPPRPKVIKPKTHHPPLVPVFFVPPKDSICERLIVLWRESVVLFVSVSGLSPSPDFRSILDLETLLQLCSNA